MIINHLLRHNLVYLEPKKIEPCEPFLFDWVKKSYPLIYTRQPSLISQDHVHLGLPHYQRGKQRNSFIIANNAIKRVMPLPKLEAVFSIPNPLISTSVFGSYAWQYLTQELYVHSLSDIDLLFEGNFSLSMLANHMQSMTLLFPSRKIDAEVRFVDLGDCSAYELMSPAPKILFKQTRAVQLISRDDLYARFPALISE